MFRPVGLLVLLPMALGGQLPTRDIAALQPMAPRFRAKLNAGAGKKVDFPLIQEGIAIGLEYEVGGALYIEGQTELKTSFMQSNKKTINGIPLLIVDPDTLVGAYKREIELITGPLRVSSGLKAWFKSNVKEADKKFPKALEAAAALPHGNAAETLHRDACIDWVSLYLTLEVLQLSIVRAYGTNAAGTLPKPQQKDFVPGAQNTPIPLAAVVASFNGFVDAKKATVNGATQLLMEELKMTAGPTANAVILAPGLFKDTQTWAEQSQALEAAYGKDVVDSHVAGNPGFDSAEYIFGASRFSQPHANIPMSLKYYWAKSALGAPKDLFLAWLGRDEQAALKAAINGGQDTAFTEAKATMLYFFNWIGHHRNNWHMKEGRAWNSYKNSWQYLWKSPVGDFVRAIEDGAARAAIQTWYSSRTKEDHCSSYFAAFHGAVNVAGPENNEGVAACTPQACCEEFLDATFKLRGHPRYKHDTATAYTAAVETKVLANGEVSDHSNYDAALPVSNKDPLPPMRINGDLCAVAEQRTSANGEPSFTTDFDDGKNIKKLDGLAATIDYASYPEFEANNNADTIAKQMDRAGSLFGASP